MYQQHSCQELKPPNLRAATLHSPLLRHVRVRPVRSAHDSSARYRGAYGVAVYGMLTEPVLIVPESFL